MIITDKIIWMHVGKAAGTTTRGMFYYLKGSIDPSIEMNGNVFYKHDNITIRTTKYDPPFEYSREELLAKDKILNIRRLPSYILSRSEYRLKIKNTPYTKDNMLKGFSEGGGHPGHHVDRVLEKYIEENEPVHWLRSEHINEDFIKCMSNYYDLTDEHKKHLLPAKYNTNDNYDKNINNLFSKSDMEEMYNNCPLWTKYEEEIYGDLLI